MSDFKNATIEQLKKKAKPEDKIIMEFFEKYRQLCIEVESVLFPAYDDFGLGEKLYGDHVDKNLANFYKEMQNNGMEFGQVEGTYFVSQNNDFIKEVLLPHVNPVSAQYINLYCDQRTWTEGMMYLTMDAGHTVELIYQCGELLDKADGLEYKDKVEGSFREYLGYLFSQGGEYQCAWQWQEQDIEAGTARYMLFSEYAANKINEIIEKHPSSRAAKEFKPYMAALKKMNYRDTNYRDADGKFYAYVEAEKGNAFIDTRDGQFYKMVKIGEQVWMGENLNFAAKGSKCYSNNSDYCAKYGRLYDWETAKKSCPNGWHLPSTDEWEALTDYATGETKFQSGHALKSASGWNVDDRNNDGSGADKYGFTALPGGAYSGEYSFHGAGDTGTWWSASEKGDGSGIYWGMNCRSLDTFRDETDDKTTMFSVRCLQD
jgi:uncharacterized protein (TIGR02145 family)